MNYPSFAIGDHHHPAELIIIPAGENMYGEQIYRGELHFPSVEDSLFDLELPTTNLDSLMACAKERWYAVVGYCGYTFPRSSIIQGLLESWRQKYKRGNKTNAE